MRKGGGCRRVGQWRKGGGEEVRSFFFGDVEHQFIIKMTNKDDVFLVKINHTETCTNTPTGTAEVKH